MLSQTKVIIDAALAADGSISPNARKMIYAALGDNGADLANRIPRIVRREEVARLLGISRKRVDQIVAAGGLVRVYSPGAKRGMGFSEESVRALVEGRSGKAVPA